MLFTSIISLILLNTTGAVAEQVRVIGLNIEGGYKPDATLETIVQNVKALSPADLWGFSEVTESEWPDSITEATGQNSKFVLGTTSNDRLLAVYNSEKFTLVESFELDQFKFGDNGRAPLVLHLRHLSTGTEILFVVNHLHRSANVKRSQQARGLNIWGSKNYLPIIAVGDYNFDWNISPSLPYRDRGFDLLVADDVFVWVRPDVLVKTQCSKKYNSVLDFAFVANSAKQWPRESRILSIDDNCEDTGDTYDHRPVELVIDIP